MSFKSAQSAKIGKIFKQKRLLMSITLEEVAEKTFINIEYLHDQLTLFVGSVVGKY